MNIQNMYKILFIQRQVIGEKSQIESLNPINLYFINTLYTYIVHVSSQWVTREIFYYIRNMKFYDLCSEINKTCTIWPCQSTNLSASQHQQSSLSQRDKRSLEEGLVQLNQKSIQ